MLKSFPDNWGADSLSKFIDDALNNTFATFTNLAQAYDILKKIDDLYRLAIDNLVNTPDWFASFFLMRCHSCYLGAVRLALSGQTSETYMLLRGCIENSLYGLYMHLHPESQETWINRHDNDECMKKVKGEFTIKNLLMALQKIDKNLHNSIGTLYERTIDYGAHPNERALSSNLRMEKTEEHVKFTLNYMAGNSPELLLCLKTTAQVGAGGLLVFKNIYQQRFDILGISHALEKIKKIGKL